MKNVENLSELKHTQLAALNLQITALEELGADFEQPEVAILPAAVFWTVVATVAGTLCLANKITDEQAERIQKLADEIRGDNPTPTLSGLIEARKNLIAGRSDY